MFELRHVAPLAGAWIEIQPQLPVKTVAAVAPLAGAWIEIGGEDPRRTAQPCRSPRGSVD